jgi:two-component system OmpR family response regulator
MLHDRPGLKLHEAAQAGLPVRVLVADDDPDMRKLIAVPLRGEGYMVTEVKDGDELLACVGGASASAREHVMSPNVIILDLCMPKRDGFEILAALRGSKWKVPIIVITALDEEGIHDKKALRGATAFLRKPFPLSQLRSMVRVVVNSCGGDS